MREVVEAELRANTNWREHPGEPSPWEDLLADPATDRVRLSPDLAAMRQMQREVAVPVAEPPHPKEAE